ncbi:hypothetical protein KI387_034638, partial [Taxus chinensis]
LTDATSEVDKETVIEVKKMLDLDGEKDRAVAVFLCGEKFTGKNSIAEQVCSDLQNEHKKWKSVSIDIYDTEKVQERLASGIDIVPGLRAKIITLLVPQVSEQGRANEQELANEQDLANDIQWHEKLSTTLTNVTNVFMYIDAIPSADILKRILPVKVSRRYWIRVLLSISDKTLLSSLDGSEFITRLHVIKTLSYNEALDLFREKLAASRCDTMVVTKIIKICKGYKSGIEIVREYLVKYYADDDEAFKRLAEWIKIQEPDFVKLGEYLKCEEKFLHQSVIAKDALLDICSFFNGWDWHETACIIDDDVLEKLKKEQLVNRVSNKVSVRDPVMTYCLSRTKGNRITSATDLHDVLAEGKFHAIKGIWLLQNKLPFRISSSQLDRMTELRVLALGDWTVVRGLCTINFRHLRYFQAGRVEHLPFHINQTNAVRYFDNSSKHDFPMSSNQAPPTLRMMRSKVVQLDSNSSNMKQLEQDFHFTKVPEACELTELDISGSKLDALPKAVCEIYALQKLLLNQWKYLKSLPKSFGKLQCLKMLDLSHCEELTDLSPNFGWLRSLEKVNFSYCRHLKELPDSMGLLSSVKEIDFSYCKSIEKLPKTFVKLSTLRVLKMKGCRHLLELPEGFEALTLTELCLESCKRLRAVFDERVGEASLSQKKLSLSWCLSVPELSKGFINLINAQVEELILVDCMSLQELPDEICTELGRLKILNLSGCESLLRLPARFQKLQYLEKLNLSSCEKLDESSIKLSRLQSLTEVNLSNCHGLEGSCLTNLTKIQSLNYLDIHGSPNLVDRWNQLNRDKKNCQLVVTTVRPGLESRSFSESLKSDNDIVKESRRGIYEFFNDKWFFVDVNGRQFHPSILEDGTTLAVIFYHDYQKQEIEAVEQILDDIRATCKTLQVVHVGSACVSELARELAGKHRVYSCDNYGAQVFFEKALHEVEDFDQSMSYAMIISAVVYRKSHKTFSGWTSISNESVRLRATTMDVSKTQYLRLMELIEGHDRQQSCNRELLRRLLLTREIKFLISSTKQVKIEELQGKVVFLLLSWLHSMEAECMDFKNVYKSLKTKWEKATEIVVGFEVVWIPIVIQGTATRAVHAKWIKEIEWPSIADPWSINPIVMHYFRRNTSINKLPVLLAVSPTGIFHSDNLIPNTDKEEAELKKKNLQEVKNIREELTKDKE